MCYKPRYFIERKEETRCVAGKRRHSSCPFPAGVSLLRETKEMLCMSLFCCLFAQERRKLQQAQNSICSLDKHVNISPETENAIRFRSTTNPPCSW